MSSTPSGDAPRFEAFNVVVDIELTSRCNATCSFCPRDETPHQGLIDERTFTAALGRAVEYRDTVREFQRRSPGFLNTPDDTIWLSFCGMGEPLLHPRVVDYIGRVAEQGLRPIINTNGALLTPERAEALMDAGLSMACINVGETGEQYDAVYGLPFERTRANVEHFLDAAPGRCIAVIVLVDHRDDADHAASMREYWSERGATAFAPFSLINRAGSLTVEDQHEAWLSFDDRARAVLERRGEATRCAVPFLYPFIGYDGNYYLCSSDWRKEVNLGNVFEHSLVDLFDEKAERVRTRSPICADCTHEPTNKVALAMAREADRCASGAPPEPDRAPALVVAGLEHVSGCVTAMRADMPRTSPDRRPRNRRLIPVRS